MKTLLKTLFFWEGRGLQLDSPANPYAALLAGGLAPRGIELVEGSYAFERKWLAESRDQFDVLHLNWLDRFYARFDGPPDAAAALQRFTDFTENLLYARHLGYRLVWTIHNLFPHERPYPQLDRLVNALVAREADHIIAHCNYAADRINETYHPPRRPHVIPHGNYLDVFPNEVSRGAARDRLDLDAGKFVYVFFGNARAYKGLEPLVRAFRAAAGADDVLLLVTRENPRAPGILAALRQLTAEDQRVRIYTSPFFAADQFQYYLNAADVVVLPFTDVLTSGSAIQALGFGKPLIMPRLGCLPELVDERCALLYDPDAADGLSRALGAARQLDVAAAGAAAAARAAELDWDGIAERIAQLYRGEAQG